ncbi:MAG: thioredoxin fold domain-containing protein [Alphaproteobacteria bacterium]|nr:thioredoxin fold domain-containing protein [Alphaproteobacteria bacterium]
MAPKPTPVVTASATPTPTTSTISIQPVKVDPDSPSEKLLKILKAGNWVEFGKPTAPLVYAFIDPECSHCHQFIADLREKKSYETSDIRTRLLPVGIMGKESLYEAAKLIDELHPQKAFFDHMDGDEFALPVDEKYNIQKVQENMAIMQDWELDVTPFVIYRNKMGQVKIIRGRPKDIDALLTDIK